MNFLQGRPNWAFTAIDTIAMPSQANLLEINEPSGYEVGISQMRSPMLISPAITTCKQL